MTLYMAVTADRYELPLVVETSIQYLARALGRSPGYIRSEMSLSVNGKAGRKGKKRGYWLRKVEVNEDDQ